MLELNDVRNPVNNSRDSIGDVSRLTIEDALFEETRGPDGRKSYANIIRVLEKATNQIFHRLPNLFDSANGKIGKWERSIRVPAVKYVRENYYTPYRELPYHFWMPRMAVFGFLMLILTVIKLIYLIFYTALIFLPEIALMMLYSCVVLVCLNIYDLYCYVRFKLFVAGLSSSFALTEPFAKKNKFQYNWKSYAKILKRYRAITLFSLIIFFPIITYEAIPAISFQYDGGYDQFSTELHMINSV